MFLTNNSTAAIDISTSAVKWLELAQIQGRIHITHCGIEPLPPDTFDNKNTFDTNTIAETLRRCQKRIKSKTRKAVIALPDHAVIQKRVHLPADLDHLAAESYLYLHGDQYFPFPAVDAALDFILHGPSRHHPRQQKATLYIAHQTLIDERCALLSAAGLQANAIDIVSLATLNAIAIIDIQQAQQTLTKQCIAVVDIGAVYTNTTIIHCGNLYFHRAQRFGGKQLTEAVMRHFGMSYKEAGIAKQNGDLPARYTSEVLQPFQYTLIQNLKHCIDIYRNTNGPEPQQILLAGGCANIPSIDQAVHRALGINTRVLNPIMGFQCSDPHVDRDMLLRNGSALLVAVGLASRDIVNTMHR